MAGANESMPVTERLSRGARYMGDLWRKGLRCASGWSIACPCNQQTEFCKGKSLWVKLLLKAIEQGEERDIPEPDAAYGIIEAMRRSELEASGLVMKVRFATGEEWRVGTGADCPMSALVQLSGCAASVPSAPVPDLGRINEVMASFPGAKIISVDPPPKAVPGGGNASAAG